MPADGIDEPDHVTCTLCPALNEQLVIVTGGARGLGAHITRAFLREGARVVINYLNSADAAGALAATAPVSYTHLTLPTKA